MRRIAYLLLIILPAFGCTQKETSKSASEGRSPEEFDWVEKTGAKSFPEGQNVFLVNDYGGVNDGKTLNTTFIQSAIDSCAAQGGGIVKFAPGQYLTGSVFVKEGVNLRIDEGVTILGSQNIRDYPDIDTRVAGIEMVWPAALINVIKQKNAAVTGSGIIHAQGKPFWDEYWATRKEYEKKGLRWIVDYDVKRPRTLLVSESSHITIKDLTLKQAGFWTVHILYSENVTADGLIIRNNVDGHGPSTDGIDIDSSSWILVENCDIDCNDDNFCLKAGRDADGLRVNRPTEYVVIRNSVSRKGGGLITFGSETSGGIRHILAHNLKAEGTGVGLRFKSALTRGGTVENIYLQDISMEKVGVAIEVAMSWNPAYSYSSLPEGYNIETVPEHWRVMLKTVPEEKGIPVFRDIYISDIAVKEAEKAIVALGVEKSWIQNFHFKNVDINTETAGIIEYARNWTFENVELITEDKSSLHIVESENIEL